MNVPIVLASASPRRQELLKLITPDFEIAVSQAEEEAEAPASLPVEEHPGFYAQVKAEDIAKQYPDKMVIGSDTGVLVADESGQLQMLGKPVDDEDARRMLRLLSGKLHYISTGCCICYQGQSHVFVEIADVEMYDLSEQEIEEYLAIGEHVDKAGSYAIQGYGSLLIKGMKGNFQTVVGLPVSRLKREIERIIAK